MISVIPRAVKSTRNLECLEGCLIAPFFFLYVNIYKMITYGKYDGSLMVILRQNRKGFFILDIYNKAWQRFRFYTIVNDQIVCNDIVNTGLFDTPEGIIDTLLDNVVSGTYKKWFWLFVKRIPENVLKSYVKLVKEKYREESRNDIS